ncbi:alpha/beta hydrolase fold domain-containing protein [Streptomyces ipomoeae]|jgi:hypothetical protein
MPSSRSGPCWRRLPPRPPYLFELTPVKGRRAVDEVQSGDIALPAVDKEWVMVPGRPTGTVRACVVRPPGATGALPVGVEAAVVFPEYDLSPEARYPVAIERTHAVARWIADQLQSGQSDREHGGGDAVVHAEGREQGLSLRFQQR